MPRASWPPPPRLEGPKRLHHKEQHSLLVRLPLETGVSSRKACLLPGQTGERCHPPTPTDCLGRESVTRPGLCPSPGATGTLPTLPIGGGLSHSPSKGLCTPHTAMLCPPRSPNVLGGEKEPTPAKRLTRARPAAGRPHDPRGTSYCCPISRVRSGEGTEPDRLTNVLPGVPDPSRVGLVRPGREGQRGRGGGPGPEPTWSLVADRVL